jgi:hypothetical protein
MSFLKEEISLFAELLSPHLEQCCERKNTSKFQDFPDRKDINQNQKKKAEIERLQLLIKQGLGKHLYSENPNNITTNEEELEAREVDMSNFASTLWVYLDLSFLIGDAETKQTLVQYPPLIKAFHRKSKCRLILLVDKSELKQSDCGEDVGDLAYDKNEMLDNLMKVESKEERDLLNQKFLDKQSQVKTPRTCCIRHYLPEGYMNYVQSYDDYNSLKLYAISSARYTRGVILSNNIEFSVFSRIKYAPLRQQLAENMEKGELNILNMEKLTNSLQLKYQADLFWLHASSELLVDHEKDDSIHYIKRKFTATEFLTKISRIESIANTTVNFKQSVLNNENHERFVIDESLLIKTVTNFLDRHKTKIERKSKHRRIQLEDYVTLLGKVMRDLQELENGRIVNNFFDEKMMAGCSNLSDFCE